jgi:hypothetical protein
MPWILCTLFFCLLTSAFAQQTGPIRLNQHYFEIAAEDSTNHFFDKLVSYSSDSTMLERIFARDGKVHRVVITKPPKEEYHERVTDQYNEYNELEWRKTENLNNGKFLTLYYFDNKVVGQVLSDSSTLYHVARNGETEPTQQNFNDFEPQIVGPIDEWHEFIFNNFQLSAKIRTEKPETFWIAILVNKYGMVDQIEWANPLEGNPKIAAQFIRAVKRWGNNFTPAVDSFGHPVTKWLMIPFRVDRPTRGTTKPIRVYNDFI